MKGLCPICHKYRWLGGKGRVCKPCGYQIGICVNCGSERKIYVSGLCYLCYQHRQVAKQINEIENNINPCSDYNLYLFKLYLTYIRRYRLQYFHMKQLKKLVPIVEKIALPQVTRWLDIYQLAQSYPLTHRVKNSGHAFLKIGYMLQELGVLPPKCEELGRQKNSILTTFDESEKPRILAFVEALTKVNCAEATIIDYLSRIRTFYLWLKTEYPCANLTIVNEQIARKYLDHLSDKPKYRHEALLNLRKFYRFLSLKREIFNNPWQAIKFSAKPFKINVCREDQIRQIQAFIKNPDVNPQQAFLLALILYFGFTTECLQFCQIEITNDKLILILRRKPLTKGKRYYNREQILTLPTKPLWFLTLQKKFIKHWFLQYKKTKKTYPAQFHRAEPGDFTIAGPPNFTEAEPLRSVSDNLTFFTFSVHRFV